MKSKKRISIKELQMLDLSKIVNPLYVDVPYTANGKRTNYLCEIKPALTGGEIFIFTKIPVKGYHTYGVLFYDKHDPTDFGQNVETFVLNRGLGIQSDRKSISYCTRINIQNGELSNELVKFVKDVANIIPVVDRMIINYINDKKSA